MKRVACILLFVLTACSSNDSPSASPGAGGFGGTAGTGTAGAGGTAAGSGGTGAGTGGAAGTINAGTGGVGGSEAGTGGASGTAGAGTSGTGGMTSCGDPLADGTCSTGGGLCCFVKGNHFLWDAQNQCKHGLPAFAGTVFCYAPKAPVCQSDSVLSCVSRTTPTGLEVAMLASKYYDLPSDWAPCMVSTYLNAPDCP